ncbi:MAG TPA: N-acetylmuramoyl-L-alanine amidase [Thermoanaerobaculia bacterium]|nr:N-acetylmuramoyl-L-alanine amidase [Thermoanaerobaculia bacterium]
MVRFFLASALAVLPALSLQAEVRSVRLVRQGAGLSGGRLEAGVTVRADGLHAERNAAYVSPPLDAGLAFSAIGPHWKAAPGAEIEIAVSADGLTWGRWIPAPSEETIDSLREDGTSRLFGGDALGPLVFVSPDSRWVRYRVRLPTRADGEPSLSRIVFHLIDPGEDEAEGPPAIDGTARDARETREPDRSEAPAPRRARAPAPEEPEPVSAAPRPSILSRSAWGARAPKYAYSYTRAGHVGIHHTASVDDFAAPTRAECAGRLRAIQAFHMDTNGWNDIGYAWVVCRHGDVFQGREDDDDTTDVQGAHDGFNRGSTGLALLGYFHPPYDQRPTEEQLSALVDLIAWISGLRGIDPAGRSLYEAFGAEVDNVYGHREVKETSCPGDHLFARKELLRAAALEKLLVGAL